MLPNEYTVSLQLGNSRMVPALPNHFKACECDKYSKSDYQDFGIVSKSFENLQEPGNKTNMSKNLENNTADAFASHEQNYDVSVAFRMSPTLQINTMPPPLHNVYFNTLNNNGIFKNCNKRNGWKNFTSKPHGCESDDSNKPISNKNKPSDNGAKHKIPRNGNRIPYEHTLHYTNNYKYSFPTMFAGSFPINHHNTSNFDKPRFLQSNGKRQRREYKRIYSDEIVRRVHGLMERFSSKAALLQISPAFISMGNNQPSQLDLAIWDIYLKKTQSQETYFRKLDLWRKVYLHITKLFDRYGLFMVGSTMSGLGTENSDIDMCLLLRASSSDPRADAVRCLEMIRNSLLSCDFVESPEVIHAKVPILKFKSAHHGFEVDLNCNNSVGIRNTHLLHCYAQLDWRVRPLVIVVKLWAQANCINDAKNMTISSYSLALMVLHFLQCKLNFFLNSLSSKLPESLTRSSCKVLSCTGGVTPPVIPCLHGLYHNKFNPEKEIHDIDIQEELQPFFSDNKQSLGELLLGFIQYYTYFNYETYAISVRLASRVPIDECRYARSPKNDPHQWKYLCIEEPFDLTNTARSVYDLPTFKRIQRVFQISSQVIRETESLSNILTDIETNQR